jgi:predicted nuclease of predicted toxin-antitoxin system
MNLLADESVDCQIVDRLRQEGHRVWYVAELEPGVSDEQVLDLANREADLLLTADKDFGELVFRQRRLAPGVLLIRLAGLPPADKAQMVASAVSEHAPELSQAFAVVTPRAIRIRRPGEATG